MSRRQNYDLAKSKYIIEFIGGMVTVVNAEGKPVQVPAAALQAANVQNQIGMH